MNIIRTSPISGIVHVMNIDVSHEQLARWRKGELIQNAMPHLTDDEREFIMTGITPEEWSDFMSVGIFDDEELEQ